MSLGQEAVDTLTGWGPFSDQARTLTVQSDTVAIEASVSKADALGCSLGHLRLRLLEPAELSVEQLTAWGQRLSERLRYLLESIETVEVDQPQGRLLLRSSPPDRKDQDTLYYELLVESGGRLQMTRHRYRAATGQRTAEPMVLTHEALEKLIDDLAATAP